MEVEEEPARELELPARELEDERPSRDERDEERERDEPDERDEDRNPEERELEDRLPKLREPPNRPPRRCASVAADTSNTRAAAKTPTRRAIGRTYHCVRRRSTSVRRGCETRPVKGLAVVIVLSVLVGAGVTWHMAEALRYRVPYGGEPRPMDAHFDAAIAAHLAELEARGFRTAAGEGEASPDGSEWSTTVDVPAESCVSLTVAPAGCLGVSASTVDGQTERIQWLLEQPNTRTHCAWGDAESVRFSYGLEREWRCNDGHEGGALRWVARARPIAGDPPPPGLEQATQAAAEAWLARHPVVGESIGEALDIAYETGARLVPANAATCHTLYALANEGEPVDVFPRTPDACPPSEVTVRETRDAVTGGEARLRVLAVLDPGALGLACAHIRLTRLRRGESAPPPVARSLGQDTPLEDTESGEGFVFDDLRCPADGVVSYLASAADAGLYRLQVHRAPAPEGAAPRPAPTPASFPVPRALPAPVERLATACLSARVNAVACIEFGLALRTGADGVAVDLPRSAWSFERACAAELPRACAIEASLTLAAANADTDDEVRQRAHGAIVSACETGDGLSCALQGDLDRIGSRGQQPALDQAYARYGVACDRGVASACENRVLMAELALVSTPALGGADAGVAAP
ncbi:MAG: hypothetical protein AB8I08_34765 [Sandaracinaceae bacterium]